VREAGGRPDRTRDPVRRRPARLELAVSVRQAEVAQARPHGLAADLEAVGETNVVGAALAYRLAHEMLEHEQLGAVPQCGARTSSDRLSTASWLADDQDNGAGAQGRSLFLFLTDVLAAEIRGDPIPLRQILAGGG